jgi:transposase
MKYREAPMPRDQLVLIPATLDDLIASDHPIRLFDEILDKLDWSAFEDGYRLEKRGQPPLPPRIVAAVLLFGLLRDVRSSRKLEYHLNTNIEFMWLAHGHRIDHATFCEFRRRHHKAIKSLHRDLIRLAKDLGVVRLGELYVDGTRIQADANRSKTLTAAKAASLLEKIEREIQERLQQLELADQVDELFESEISGEQLPAHLRDLQKRKEALQQILETCQAADAERKKNGVNPEKNPFQLPTTDPDSRILPNKEGGYAPNYTPIIAVEGQLGLIVATTLINSPNEQDQIIGLVDDVEQDYGVTVETVAADTAYSTGVNITELEEERGIDFLSPLRRGVVAEGNPAQREDLTKPVAEEDLDKLPTDRTTKKFSVDAFVYDAEQDVYYCPQGRVLTRVTQERVRQSSGLTVLTTHYQCERCDDCPLVTRCRVKEQSKNGRRVKRDEHEDNRQRHREKMSDPEVQQRYAKRFAIGERPFGAIKQNMHFRRFLTRGQESVETEWGLVITAHNLTRLMNTVGTTGAVRARLATTP